MYFRTAIFALFVAACSSTTPPAEVPVQGNDAAETAPVAAQRPDTEKLIAHLEQHVKYPASRADVLAACAQTPEFTDGEKQWTADNLPEGEYETAQQTAAALGI